MKGLEWTVRAFLYAGSLGLYVLVAAWVGQDEFHHAGARFLAAVFSVLWLYATGLAVEVGSTAKSIAEALTEDDQ